MRCLNVHICAKCIVGGQKQYCTLQDEEKAEDEMAKRRAAFLLKQQRKAEETRLRKQQLEAESELKRDEARYVCQLTAAE